MFQGELFAGKRLLPDFGGAAYVWCTVILFFQIVLIVGYYSSRALAAANSRTRALILALLGLSGLLTLIPRLPQAAWLPPELQPLVALLPFAGLSVALFTTTPLLHRRQANRANYRIYAWSNAGAFLGLLAYPFVVEPLTPLWVQNLVWAVGGLLIATVGLAGPGVPPDRRGRCPFARFHALGVVGPARRFERVSSSPPPIASVTRRAPARSHGRIPLAVFLFTYVLAFGSRRHMPIGAIAMVGLVLLAVSFVALGDSFWMLPVILAVGGAGMLACNAWLAATRNENSHGFYRANAVGGAIGTAFVALVVPAHHRPADGVSRPDRCRARGRRGVARPQD